MYSRIIFEDFGKFPIYFIFIFKLNNGEAQQTQGPLRFELFIEMMSNQLNLLKNETARYELIETQNEKLNQDLEVTRLERESIRKTLTVSRTTLDSTV